MLYCKKCGTELPDTAKFCSKCGVTIDETTASSTRIIFCKKCGTSLPETANYCSRCAVKIDETTSSPTPIPVKNKSNSRCIGGFGIVLIFAGVLFWSIVILVGISVTVENPITDNIVTLVLVTLIEMVHIFWLMARIQKYRSHENQEKLKLARARAEQQRAETSKRWAEEQARQKEIERLRTMVVATRLIGDGAAEYKKSVGSVAFRGAVGGLIAGSAGATIGMATAKNENTNKDVRRFLVKYLDGHIEEKEAKIGSAKYKEYMEHLVWEE